MIGDIYEDLDEKTNLGIRKIRDRYFSKPNVNPMDHNQFQREYLKETMKDASAESAGQTAQERVPLTANHILKQLGKQA